MSSKQIERRFDMFKTLAAIVIALGLALVVISFVSSDPIRAIQMFIVGPLQRSYRMGNVLERMIPFLFTGTAICIMYQANLFNMIGEGAFLIGANLCTWFAVTHTSWAGLPLKVTCIIIGLVAGMAAALIPAVLKVKFRANEVVASIMMNYVLLRVSDYLFYYNFRDTASGLQASYKLPEQARFAKFFTGSFQRVHSGLIIGLVACVLVYLFIFKTKWGYEIRMVGANQNFARYSGISVFAVAMFAQLLGGAIAGMGGAVEMLGFYDRFSWFGSQPGYGFDGVLVGVLAKNNPLMVPVTAFFLAYLRIGAATMNIMSDVPVEFVDVVQGIIIMLVAAEMFLSKYKHKLIVNNAKKQTEEKEEFI